MYVCKFFFVLENILYTPAYSQLWVYTIARYGQSKQTKHYSLSCPLGKCYRWDIKIPFSTQLKTHLAKLHTSFEPGCLQRTISAFNHKVHSVNSINDDMDENEGKPQEVCKRKDSPVKEIFVDQYINTP